MGSMSSRFLSRALKQCWITLAILLSVFVVQSSAIAQTLTVNVIDDAGNPVTNGFRWLVEEDNSFAATPGVATPSPGNPASFTLGVNIHKSHAPVLASGDSNTTTDKVAGAFSLASIPNLDPTKRYMVSVLPWHTSSGGATGYTMSGRNVKAGQTTLTVLVHPFPVPTAQMTVLVFQDTQPINAAYDAPAEHGMGGFTIELADPVGKVMQDAWGNPVGTTYKYQYACSALACVAPNVPADASGNPLSPEQQPVYAMIDGIPVVDYMGNGILKSCPTGDAGYDAANCTDPYTLTPLAAGEAVVRYLNGNKYTIQIVPPENDPDWILTGTLEGTRGNDAWVRPTEPRFNIALGQLNYLVFYGFVKQMNGLASLPGPKNGTITGQVVYAHDMHPPLSPGLSPGQPVPNAYVGLSNLSGNDEQVYTAPCDPNTGAFSIAGVPPGSYQLAMWDKNIDAIIDYRTINVPANGGTIALGKVSVYGWFGNINGSVFSDVNQNGFRDPGEAGIPGVPVNLFFSDGSNYKVGNTDPDGNYGFSEYFSWWRYLVASVDNSRYKPTGMTAVVDDGGALTNTTQYRTGTNSTTSFADLGINPQIQPGGLPYRTEQGVVLTEAIQTFQDMTNRIDWGKTAYAAGENGGIKGIVNYATTRTEEDPAQSAIDGWEPAVPRVTVNLYRSVQDATGKWIKSGGIIQTVKTDSWDDHNPTNCVSTNSTLWPIPEIVNGIAIPSCAETFHNWDQIRPGVFDGAYSFSGMTAGNYIVEVIPPPGYEVLKWGDRNIEFGDPKTPFLLYPPACVGAAYPVPQFHTLFPDQEVPTEYPSPGGWYSGATAPLCDQKKIDVADGKDSIVNFNIFTMVPKSSRIWGTVWDDLNLEYKPNSPNASGNLGVSWLPVSIKDYKGLEVARFYTDQWGHFDGLVPANYDIAPPIPLGLALAMYGIFPNDPGPIDSATGLACNPYITTVGQCITDPWFNPAYSQEVIKENWEFYAGKTTFIDTIVIPASAFVVNAVPLNCDFLDKTPEIFSVSGSIYGGGPIFPATGGVITIRSIGSVQVPNPDYNPLLAISASNPTMITRDHSFGGVKGAITVGGVAIPAGNISWAADGLTISATIPGSIATGQLIVTRGDNGVATPVGVTLHKDSTNVHVRVVSPPQASCFTEVGGIAGCRPIQDAIDSAILDGKQNLILIAPGKYDENVIMWKPVQLQGWGAPSTILDGTSATGNLPLKNYQEFTVLQNLIANGSITVVPGQAPDFTLEQGAGILVATCDPTSCPNGNSFTATGANPLIDGLTITGATEAGGGILVNGYANNLKISNNEIFANQGSLAGGIRLGTSSIADPTTNPTGSSFNPGIVIDHNRIAVNGSLFSGGGGIAVYTGANNYQVTGNMICGNFSAVYGGGIGHFGLSPNGLIQGNKVVSNESFDEGGGIHIAGELPTTPTGLTLGSGSVIVNDNLIQGNKAGDDGGGLRTLKVNGQDVQNNPTNPNTWYEVDVFNNMIVNNSSADQGGGIALDDTVKSYIIDNTIANNDSTATGSDAFGGPCTENTPPGQVCPNPGLEAIGGLTSSIPQVAGVASFAHSTALLSVLQVGGGYCAANPTNFRCATFANPVMSNDIIWHNRSFYWDATANNSMGALLPSPSTPDYWDMAVYGTATTQLLSPKNSILTTGVGAVADASNLIGSDPLFISPYLNVYLATSKGAALGNFVVATFAQNGLRGDYHIQGSSPALSAGSSTILATSALLNKDYDGQARPMGAGVEIGADELSAPTPAITVVPTSISYGSVRIGTTSLRTVTIQNTGTANLVVSAFSITGTNAAMFTTNLTVPRTITPGGSSSFTVTFAPTSTGSKSATLSLTSNAPTSPTVIPLSGSGTF